VSSFKTSAFLAFALSVAPIGAALAQDEVDRGALPDATNQEMTVRVIVRGTSDAGFTNYEDRVSSVRNCFDHVRVTVDAARAPRTSYTVVSGLCLLPDGEVAAAFSCDNTHEKGTRCRQITMP